MGPKLYFFCELDSRVLLSFLEETRVLESLQTLHAGICLAILDFSEERAAAVRLLNQAGISITAWFVFANPQDGNLRSNIEEHIQSQYSSFLEWTSYHNLQWSAIGLEDRPRPQLLADIIAKRWKYLVPRLINSVFSDRLNKKRRAFSKLAARIHADGYLLETYQNPLVLDDRLANSRLFQRLLGVTDIPGDREIFMIFSIYKPPTGSGVIWSYGQDKSILAIGAGRTLFGESDKKPIPLAWEELARDLHLTWGCNESIYLFRLEDFQQSGFLERFKNFEWDKILLEPVTASRRIDQIRLSAHVFMWIFSHYYLMLGLGFLVAFLLFPRKQIRS